MYLLEYNIQYKWYQLQQFTHHKIKSIWEIVH